MTAKSRTPTRWSAQLDDALERLGLKSNTLARHRVRSRRGARRTRRDAARLLRVSDDARGAADLARPGNPRAAAGSPVPSGSSTSCRRRSICWACSSAERRSPPAPALARHCAPERARPRRSTTPSRSCRSSISDGATCASSGRARGSTFSPRGRSSTTWPPTRTNGRNVVDEQPARAEAFRKTLTNFLEQERRISASVHGPHRCQSACSNGWAPSVM